MTTVVAVKKGKRGCIASDSLSLFGSCKEKNGFHTFEAEKILEMGPNLVGMAGHPSWSLILKDYFCRRKPILMWQTSEQVFAFFNKMHESLKNEYYLNCPDLNYLPFESSCFELLILNAQGIFEVEHSRMVRQYARFSAIGSGEEYAIGAMAAIYDQFHNPEEIAEIGVRAAAEFDRKTGLPLYVRGLDFAQA